MMIRNFETTKLRITVVVAVKGACRLRGKPQCNSRRQIRTGLKTQSNIGAETIENLRLFAVYEVEGSWLTWERIISGQVVTTIKVRNTYACSLHDGWTGTGGKRVV